MRRWTACLLTVLLLTGCSALPGEERAFAVCLGVHRTGQQWTVTARYPAYKADGGYLTAVGVGASLAGAMAAADAVSPMRLHLGQLRLLVFSRELASEEDFPEVLRGMSQWSELRLRTWLAVTETDMKTLLDAMDPCTGTRLSKDIEVLMSSRAEQGVATQVTLADWLRYGERQSLALTDITLMGEEQRQNVLEQAPGSGDMEGAVQLAGCWLFSQTGKLRGRLTPAQTQTLMLLTGDFSMGTLALGDDTVTMTNASVGLQWQAQGFVRCKVKVQLRRAGGTEDYAAAKISEAIHEVASLMMTANCDALGLARQAIMTCDTVDLWHSLDWPSRYSQLQWDVHVTVEATA